VDAEVKLSDLLDEAALAETVAEGFVRRQVHPDQPLAILNYTERCVYERCWTPVTLACRGLIFNTDTGVIVARPFPKFFNYGEHDEAALSLTEPVAITDKMDGSLAIVYRGTGGLPAVATRGSFASEQAIHATAVLRSRYPDFEPLDGYTELFEIVYPANRIVLDYGATDDLFYLGSVRIADGRTFGPYPPGTGAANGRGWTGPRARVFEGATLADALAMPPRPNAEGVVVHYHRTDVRVKIKQDDYVALHRLITGMNARVVWERIGEGETTEQICAAIPEEFWPWVREVGGELIREKNRVIDEATAEHARILALLAEASRCWGRKEYAAEAVKSPSRPWLFNLLDQRDPSAGIWRTLKPSGERTLVAYSEDTA
jgi:RNA ligase